MLTFSRVAGIGLSVVCVAILQSLQVVITDGPLPDLAAAALRADGLSILEAQDELQAFCIIWPCFDQRR